MKEALGHGEGTMESLDQQQQERQHLQDTETHYVLRTVT